MNNNTRMGLVCLLEFKSFDQFNPPEPPQILDVYSVVVLYKECSMVSAIVLRLGYSKNRLLRTRSFSEGNLCCYLKGVRVYLRRWFSFGIILVLIFQKETVFYPIRSAGIFFYASDWINCCFFLENYYQREAIGKPPPFKYTHIPFKKCFLTSWWLVLRVALNSRLYFCDIFGREGKLKHAVAKKLKAKDRKFIQVSNKMPHLLFLRK